MPFLPGFTYVLRQLTAIALLPLTVTVIVPLWIARSNGVALAAPVSMTGWAAYLAGLALLVTGLTLFGWSLALFWTRGRGTLAPWDPPRQFVADGPYRYVRNPMISGVILILMAESLMLRSWPHAAWAGGVFVINLIYIPSIEEPALEARFGESYARYKANVRRFIPRLRP